MLVNFPKANLRIRLEHKNEELYKLFDKDEWLLKEPSSLAKLESFESEKIKIVALLTLKPWSNHHENGNRVFEKTEWWSRKTNLSIPYRYQSEVFA